MLWTVEVVYSSVKMGTLVLGRWAVTFVTHVWCGHSADFLLSELNATFELLGLIACIANSCYIGPVWPVCRWRFWTFCHWTSCWTFCVELLSCRLSRPYYKLDCLRLNRLGRFGQMPWRGRPSNEFITGAHSSMSDMLDTLLAFFP